MARQQEAGVPKYGQMLVYSNLDVRGNITKSSESILQKISKEVA